MMGLSNNIYELALDRLIETLPNLYQFSKDMDYCTFSGLLMNVSSGEWEKIIRLQAKTLAEIMGQAWPPPTSFLFLAELSNAVDLKNPQASTAQ